MREANELPFHRILLVLLKIYHFQSSREAGRAWNPGVFFGLLLMTFLFVLPPLYLLRVLEGILDPIGSAALATLCVLMLTRINAEYRRLLIQGSRNPFGLLAGELWSLLPVPPARVYAASALADHLSFFPSSVGQGVLALELIRQYPLEIWLLVPVLFLWILSTWAYVCFEGMVQVILVERSSSTVRRILHHMRLVLIVGLGLLLVSADPGALTDGGWAFGLLQEHGWMLLFHPLGWAPYCIAVAGDDRVLALITALVGSAFSVGLVLLTTQVAEEVGGPEQASRVNSENERVTEVTGSRILRHPLDRLWSWRPRRGVEWMVFAGMSLAVFLGLDGNVRHAGLREPGDLFVIACLIVQIGTMTVVSGWWCQGPGVHSLRSLPVSAGSVMGQLTIALAARAVLIVLPATMAVAIAWNMATLPQILAGAAGLVLAAFVYSALGTAAYGVYIDPTRRPHEIGPADMAGGLGIPLTLVPLTLALFSGGFPAVRASWMLLLVLLILWPGARDSWRGLIELGRLESPRMRGVVALGILAMGIAAPFFGVFTWDILGGGRLGNLQWLQTLILSLSSLVFLVLSLVFRRRIVAPAEAPPPLLARVVLGVATAVISVTSGALFAYLLIRAGVAGSSLESPMQKLFESTGPSGTSLVMLLLFGVVLAPLGEELYFRGILFPALASTWGRPVAAACASAATFAFFHPPIAFPFLFVFALVLTALAVRTRSLVSSVTAHALHNAALLSLLVFHDGQKPPPARQPSSRAAAGPRKAAATPAPVRDPGSGAPWIPEGEVLAREGNHSAAALCFRIARLSGEDPARAWRLEGVEQFRALSSERLEQFLAARPPAIPSGPLERLLAIGAEVLMRNEEAAGVEERLDALLPALFPAGSPPDHDRVALASSIATRGGARDLLPRLAELHGPGWWSCPWMRWDAMIHGSAVVPAVQRARLALVSWHDGDADPVEALRRVALDVLERRYEAADRRSRALIAPGGGPRAPRRGRRACRAPGAPADPPPGFAWAILGLDEMSRGNLTRAGAAFERGAAAGDPESIRLAAWVRAEPDPLQQPGFLEIPTFLQSAMQVRVAAMAAHHALHRGRPAAAVRIASSQRRQAHTVFWSAQHGAWMALMAADWVARRRLDTSSPVWGFEALQPGRPFVRAANLEYLGCTWLACRVVADATGSVTSITGPPPSASPENALVRLALDRAAAGDVADARRLLELFEHWEAHSPRLRALEILLAVVDGDHRFAHRRLLRDTRALLHPWAAAAVAAMMREHLVPVPAALRRDAAGTDPAFALPPPIAHALTVDVTKLTPAQALRRIHLDQARHGLHRLALEGGGAATDAGESPDLRRPASRRSLPDETRAARLRAWRRLLDHPLFTQDAVWHAELSAAFRDGLEAGDIATAERYWDRYLALRPGAEDVAALVSMTIDHGQPRLGAAMLGDLGGGRDVYGGDLWFASELRDLTVPYEKLERGTGFRVLAVLLAALVAFVIFLTSTWLVRRLEDVT